MLAAHWPLVQTDFLLCCRFIENYVKQITLGTLNWIPISSLTVFLRVLGNPISQISSIQIIAYFYWQTPASHGDFHS